MKKFIKSSYFAIIMAFIYIPIIVMIVFSFNSGGTTFSFTGWSSKWYSEFFANSPFVKSIITSLFVAVISTVISLVIGTAAAIGLSKSKKVTQKTWFGIANIPLINADVVTAVSLMIVFLLAGMQFGLLTLIMAHVSFNVPYVLITVSPRLRKIDKSLLEAGYDLGAKQTQVLFRVILPILKPAIITAAAIAFAMSFDDFIISYFTGGSQTNVSTFIYTAKKVKPFVFAFGTILVGIIVFAIISWNAFALIKQKKEQNINALKNNLFKAKKMNSLNKQIAELNDNLNSHVKVKRTKRLFLWINYLILKMKLKIISSKNYDKKITRLEWKRYKLKSKIQKEKRYYTRQKQAIKRLTKINKLLSNDKLDVKKAARLTIQVEKLQDRISYLNEEILYIENRDELAAQRAEKINDQILNLKKEFSDEVSPSKKTISWYNKKIKYLEELKIEIEEGKNNYKLRLVVERLHEFKDKNYNQILILNAKLEKSKSLVYIKKPITYSIDKKIYFENNQNKIKILNLQKNNMILDFEKLTLRKIEVKEKQLNNLEDKITKFKYKVFPSIDDDQPTHFSKSFLARSWKVILISFIGLAAFSGLTVAYIKNNIYDLVIGNWGEYIDPALINEFEKEYNVRLNYQEYDSNETLYNKLYTFNYDLMVPSDYMVQRLAIENRLLKLDYSKINISGLFKDENENELNLNPNESEDQVEISSSLLTSMYRSKVDEPDEDLPLYPDQTSTNGTILGYSIPYFWGDLVMIINPTDSNIQFLNEHNVEFDKTTGEIKSDTLSWSLFWDAKEANKRLALNSDPKNIFMLAAQKEFQKTNLNSKEEVDIVKNDVESLIKAKNVSLNGDDLITKVGLGQFDFALMYNGDAVYANRVYNHEDADNSNNVGETKFLFGRPNKNGEGTNVFSDNMVISKKSNHQELAYEFINFILKNMNLLTRYVGIASPSQKALDEMINSNDPDWGDYANYKDLYIPVNLDDYVTKDKTLSFQYNGSVDDYLVDVYNSIVAGKIG